MAKLYEKYKDKGSFLWLFLFMLSNWYLLYEDLYLLSCLISGLEILAFPCNQFGNQEPGTNEEIMQFACTRFKAEYPIFDKVVIYVHKKSILVIIWFDTC